MTTRAELETLLTMDPEALRYRERLGFDQLAGPDASGIVLYGAGGLGRRTLAGLRRLGVEPLAFADNSRALQGSAVEGCPVLSPRDAVDRYNDRATFVITVWGAVPRRQMAGRRQKDIRDLLQELGCRRAANFTSLYFKHPETFLPYYAVDLPHLVLEQADEVRRGFDLMADESSRREYVAQVRWRLLQDFDALPPPVEDEQYFCDGLYRARPDEWYVDCGAFDGDTLREFVARRGGRFEHFLAIEPDPLNFDKLKACVASLPPSQARRVETRQLATGSTRSTLSLNPTGLPSSTVGGDGTVEVDCVPLDELLDSVAPTVIKMDIEGAEGDTIRGAERSIRQHQPLLEVCVYHLQDHLWTLPLLIDSIKPGYRYFLRPHKYEVWDLVCYAVPPDRMPA